MTSYLRTCCKNFIVSLLTTVHRIIFYYSSWSIFFCIIILKCIQIIFWQSEIMDIPVIGWAMKLAKHVFLKRDDIRSTLEVSDRCVERVSSCGNVSEFVFVGLCACHFFFCPVLLPFLALLILSFLVFLYHILLFFSAFLVLLELVFLSSPLLSSFQFFPLFLSCLLLSSLLFKLIVSFSFFLFSYLTKSKAQGWQLFSFVRRRH